jgi:sigma-54 dependent transcriptional regulator, acetoin dehydrogenase operon transcriptional activator AcoR
LDSSPTVDAYGFAPVLSSEVLNATFASRPASVGDNTQVGTTLKSPRRNVPILAKVIAPGTTLTQTDETAEGEAAPRPFLFLVLEANRPLAPGARFDLDHVAEITFGRGPRGHERTRGKGSEPDRLVITIPDRWMSSSHASLSRRGALWVFCDLGSRNGSRVNGVTVKDRVLVDGDVIELGGAFFVFRKSLASAGEAEIADFEASEHVPAVAGLSTLLPGLAQDLEKITRIAPSDVSVVVQGETGVGKEVMARAIHELSGRKGPFVAVNCGAIPESLVESELFGHKKGAFSGALADRSGFVRSADGGTLFLDEIGEMRPGSQTALLRVLQERQVVPLGSSQPIDVDVRVVAATHKPLAQLTGRGQFRPDLLARLSGFTLELPPLRARREDLGLLVSAFVRHAAGAAADKVTLAPPAVRALLAHTWPMNIRELQKCIEAALVLAPDGRITREHLPSLEAPPNLAAEATPPLMESTPPRPPVKSELSEAEQARRDELQRLLEEHGGNITAVAKAMGRDRTLIRRWMQRYGIDAEKFRSEE